MAAARQHVANARLIADLAKRLRALDPQIIFTCARGSSDHAATFANYLFETRLRIPTVSQAPSISSIYGAPLLHMKNQPFILISQSGKSPDLLLSAQAASKAGAIVIAFVNDIQSPLAQMAEIVVPLHAGPETKRGRHQKLYRDAVRICPADRRVERRRRDAGSGCRIARRAGRSLGIGLVGGRRAAGGRAEACSCLAVDSRWVSHRRPRSNSRRRAASTQRHSALPRLPTARWRWSKRNSRC